MASVVNRWREEATSTTHAAEAMLKIDTIESAYEIVLRLHGRLAGPWVDELESHWRRTQATAGERRVAVNLTGVTGIDGAARYLLQLMRLRNVTLVGASIAIRASLDDEATPTPEPG
jgi:ABC-type transporter Mla MlaB component